MPGKIWEKALNVAVDQNGYITVRDLRRLGENPALLRQWHQRDRITRIGHGIYRFPQVPSTPLDPFMLATLWPSGRGVLSHDSALDLHELCDINPAGIHITLPPGYRPRRRGVEQYAIHHELLKEADITWHEGIRIVTPAVAIRQAIVSDVPRQLIRQALDTAQRLGRVPRPALEDLIRQMEMA